MDTGIVVGVIGALGITGFGVVQVLSKTWGVMHTTILVVALAVAIIAGSVTAAALVWNSVNRRLVAVPLPDIAPTRDILDIQARAARRDSAEIGAAGNALRLLDRYGQQSRPSVPLTMDIGEEFGS